MISFAPHQRKLRLTKLDAYARLMRLRQPVGIWLVLWPAWWGAALADGTDWRLYALLAVGAVVTRSAGCIINDVWDRRLDRQVERTKNRPLASGEVSLREALLLLGVLCVAALGLLLVLPPACWWVGLLAVPMIAVYPLCKRITFWPQAFLGLTFNLGAFVGYLAVAGKVDVSVLLLYAGAALWTLGYDTIYAVQDKEDDAVAGIRSTARRFGSRLVMAVAIIYAGCSLALLAAWALGDPAVSAGIGWLGFSLHLAWQSWRLKRKDPPGALFRSNQVAGGLLWLGMAMAG